MIRLGGQPVDVPDISNAMFRFIFKWRARAETALLKNSQFVFVHSRAALSFRSSLTVINGFLILS
jgi:hypothetical protein